MHVTGVELRGFRDLTEFRTDGLERVVTVSGPGLAATALGDGISLAFAALSRERLAALLVGWGCAADSDGLAITGDDLPEQAVWEDRHAAASVVDPGARDLVARLELELDPPLYGRLRSEAAREPRLVSALSAGPQVALTVGALFTRSMDGLALSIQAFEVGSERFAVAGSERPRWLSALLRDLGDRFDRIVGRPAEGAAAKAVLEASTSWDRHADFLRWQATAASCADGVSVVRPARGLGGRAVLLGDDRPLSRFGARAAERAALAAAAWLGPGEVLWVESEDPWIEQAIVGEGSPLEQVWRVCEAGSLVVVSQPSAEPPGPAGLPRKRLELRPRPQPDDGGDG